MKFGIAGELAERHAENFGAKAGAPHSQQQGVSIACLFNVGGDFFQRLDGLDLLFGNIQPAEPLVFIRASPERGIFLPRAA